MVSTIIKIINSLAWNNSYSQDLHETAEQVLNFKNQCIVLINSGLNSNIYEVYTHLMKKFSQFDPNQVQTELFEIQEYVQHLPNGIELSLTEIQSIKNTF